MSENNLDQFFRNKLSELDLAIPSESDWLAAKSLVAAQKKKDRGFLWWLIVLSVFTVVFTYATYTKINPTVWESDYKSELPAMASTKAWPEDKVAAAEDVEPSIQKQTKDSEHLGKHSSAVVPSTLENKVIVQQNGSDKASRIPPTDAQNLSVLDPVKGIFDDRSEDLTSQPEVKQQEIRNEVENLNRLASTTVIPTIFSELVYDYGIERPQPHMISAVLDNPKFRANRYAWTGTLLMNPNDQIAEPVRGVQLGYLAEFYFQKRLFVGLRPSLQVTMNEQGFSKLNIQTTYSFSAVNETYGLRASSLQFVRLPVYVGLEVNKHTFEVGAGANWLLAARGELQQVEFENNDVELVNAFSSGWIDTDQMRSITYNLFLGYKLAINQRMKVGVTLFHNPENIYPALSQQNGSGLRKWSMGLQLNYYTK